MKRSASVSLVLLASVSAVATLSGCGQEEVPDNGGTFTNQAECIATYDVETCKAAETLARQDHLRNAPQFGSRADCAAQFGAEMCQPSNVYGGSGNTFMPMMIGYMMGSANSRPAPLYYGPGAYRHRYDRSYTAPIVSSGRGFARNQAIGSAPFSQVGGKSTKGALKSGTAISTGTVPTQRGGFGSSFKPTNSFKATYVANNPSAFGRSSLPSTSARFASVSRASSSSISSRGGFGSSGRGFSGSFGG